MLNWDASSSLIRPQPGSRLRQLTAKFRVLFPQPFEFGLQCAWIGFGRGAAVTVWRS